MGKCALLFAVLTIITGVMGYSRAGVAIFHWHGVPQMAFVACLCLMIACTVSWLMGAAPNYRQEYDG